MSQSPDSHPVERRYEYLFGSELDDLIKECPIAWVALGPLEKHGNHLPLGLDAFKAHAQCLLLGEKFGGVVLPAIHIAGIHDPWDPDPEVYRKMRAEVRDWYLRYETFRMLIEDMIDGLANIGFRLIVLNTGHYGRIQGKFLDEIVEKKKQTCSARIEVFYEEKAEILTDHAGIYETSAYMALCGEAKLDRVTEEQWGKPGFWSCSPTAASREFGWECMQKIEGYFSKVISETKELLSSRHS